MRFWDTSALLASAAGQAQASELGTMLQADPRMVVWWGTWVEYVSGACSLRRQGRLDDQGLSALLAAGQAVMEDADCIEPSEHVRRAAVRLLRVHDLRAADALQLAAALVWAGHEPSGAGFVCLDKRLRVAASREGFAVLPGSAG